MYVQLWKIRVTVYTVPLKVSRELDNKCNNASWQLILKRWKASLCFVVSWHCIIASTEIKLTGCIFIFLLQVAAGVNRWSVQQRAGEGR